MLKFSHQQTQADNQMDVDAVLLSDDSEIELETVDKVGLNPAGTKRIKKQPSHSHLPPTPTPPFSHFGCTWDPNDYSCSYDSVFMAFAWMYFHAPEHWRKTWAGQLRVAKTLSQSLRSILRALNHPASIQPAQQIMPLFSSGRNTLRDVLSEEDPNAFRRHGQVDACLTDILQSLSHDQTSSQYFSFVLSCGGPTCTVRVKTPRNAPLMLTPDVWASHSRNPPHHESLQEWITAYFNHEASLLSRSCPKCRRDYSQTRSFLRPPWLWFEVFVEQTNIVLPSFELKFSSHTYRLAAVAYGDGCHFVARLSTPSGTWWYYDDRVNGGRPTEDSIVHEEDLITCGDRFSVNALVYCRTG